MNKEAVLITAPGSTIFTAMFCDARS